MLIGIDGNEANVKRRVGIGEYAFELLWQFKKFRIQNSEFRIYLKNDPKSDLPAESENWKYKVFGPSKLWTQFALPSNLYIKRPRPSVFFSPSHYAPRFSPVPTVISLMDLSYIHYPEMFRPKDLYQLRNWGSYSIKNAKKILTISKASRDDIIKEYRVAEEKIVVTYPGIKMTSSKFKISHEAESRSARQNSKILKEKYGVNGEYILFVGTLQPRKNLLRLMEAFSRVCHPERSEGSRDSSPSAQNDIRLLIVGKKGWMYGKILDAPEKFGVKDKVKFLDFVPDEDLPLFYQNAICFVLPSLYEGFGLPVLEAMKYGCPVITSSVSSLPEAGGDAAIYVDPENTEDIAEKIKLVIKDEKLRKKMIEEGYKQAARFSWENTAKETLNVLTEVVKNG